MTTSRATCAPAALPATATILPSATVWPPMRRDTIVTEDVACPCAADDAAPAGVAPRARPPPPPPRNRLIASVETAGSENDGSTG